MFELGSGGCRPNQFLERERALRTYQTLLDCPADLMGTVQIALACSQSVTGPSEISTLKTTLLKVLVAEAILQRLMGDDPISRRAAAENVLEIVRLTESFGEEDYLFLDVIAGVSAHAFAMRCRQD